MLTVMESTVIAVVRARDEARKSLLRQPLFLLLVCWAMDGISVSTYGPKQTIDIWRCPDAMQRVQQARFNVLECTHHTTSVWGLQCNCAGVRL